MSMTMQGFLAVTAFLANCMGLTFTALDSIILISDPQISFLDLFIASIIAVRFYLFWMFLTTLESPADPPEPPENMWA